MLERQYLEKDNKIVRNNPEMFKKQRSKRCMTFCVLISFKKIIIIL